MGKINVLVLLSSSLEDDGLSMKYHKNSQLISSAQIYFSTSNKISLFFKLVFIFETWFVKA